MTLPVFLNNLKDRLAWLAMVALVLCSGAWVQAQQPDPTEDVLVPAIPGLAQPVAAALPPPSPFWIGLECFPAEPALRAQLGLEEGVGLVVAQVAPDSPAAKAGVERHDVIVAADERPLGDVRDLIAAVNAACGVHLPKAGESEPKAEEAVPAADNKLSLELLRAGKQITLVFEPAKREEVGAPAADDLLGKFGGNLPGLTIRGLPEWMEKLGAGPNGQGPFSFRVVHPYVVLEGGLPENMKVTITKQGKEPAKIVVEQDGKTWEVTQDTLSELPAEVLAHVEPMLRPLTQFPPKAAREVERVERELLGRVRGIDIEGEIRERLERRLDQLNKQFDELRRNVDELRRPAQKEKPAPAAADDDAAPAEDLPQPDTENNPV